MQEVSYLGKIPLTSICFRMVLTLIATWVHMDLSPWEKLGAPMTDKIRECAFVQEE